MRQPSTPCSIPVPRSLSDIAENDQLGGSDHCGSVEIVDPEPIACAEIFVIPNVGQASSPHYS